MARRIEHTFDLSLYMHETTSRSGSLTFKVRRSHKYRKEFPADQKDRIERFSLVTSKQFDDVVAAINAGIGHPDMAESPQDDPTGA